MEKFMLCPNCNQETPSVLDYCDKCKADLREYQLKQIHLSSKGYIPKHKIMLLLIISLFFVFEIILFIITHSISGIMRSFIAVIIFYFFYQGQQWAYITLIVLFALALVFIIFSTYPLLKFVNDTTLTSHQAIALLVFIFYCIYIIFSLFLMIFSKELKGHFRKNK